MSDQVLEVPLTPKKLTNKAKLFVEEYLRCGNATRSATEAGYSAKTAYSIGSELLKKPEIQAEIQKRVTDKIMGADEVLSRLSDMSRANLLPFIRITDEGFTYFDFSHPDAKNYFHLIKKIKTKRTRRVEGKGENAEVWEDEWVEVELHDAQSALEKIGKYHHLFKDEIDLTSAGKKIKAYIGFSPADWDEDEKDKPDSAVPAAPVATPPAEG